MAKKFHFRLDTLLRIKNYAVQKAGDELQRAVSMRNQKEEEIVSKDNLIIQMSKSSPKGMNLLHLQAQFHHKLLLRDEISFLEREKQNILEIENLKRKVLSDKMIEEKTIEKLKEKKKAQYKFDLDRQEDMLLDGIALSAAYNKQLIES